MHTTTRIHSRPQAANDLQEYIQIFTDLVLHANGSAQTVGTCQMTTVFHNRQLFNKEIKKPVTGAKIIQTVRHAITLTKEAETKLK